MRDQLAKEGGADIMLSRRDAIKAGLLAGGALVMPPRSVRADDKIAPSPATLPFRVPLPISPILLPTRSDATADFYEVTMRAAQAQILPGLSTTVWGYNGLFPGPTIMAEAGRLTVVRQRNHLPENMSVHLHGCHTPSASDGFPNDFIRPGAFKDYSYPNDDRASSYWYHDHAMDITGPHINMGLAAFYIIHDAVERSLPLPTGAQDVPLMICDRLFNADGSFFYDTFNHDGFLGDTFLVNGAVQPFFQVSNRKYRFRFLNVSNARWYEFALSSGQPFIQIGTDGGLLPAPIVRPRFRQAPAERIDVIIDFSIYPVGTQIVLQSVLQMTSGRKLDGVSLQAPTPIMRFDVVRTEADTSAIPATLRPLPVMPESSAVRTRLFEFQRDRGAWTINGQFFDPNRVDAAIRLGTTEIWRLKNGGGGWAHPIHLHLSQFLVLDRNGGPIQIGDQGLKDTLQLEGGDEVRVIGTFKDRVGRYVFHCHNLEHEDMRMMGRFDVEP